MCRTSLRIILMLVLAPACTAGELQTLSGKTVTGDLVSLSLKEAVFKSGTGPVVVPAADLLQIDLQKTVALPAGTKYADLELTDGSVLHCSKFVLKGKDIEATLAGSNLKVAIPISSVSHILNDAQENAGQVEWREKILPKRSNTDLLVIKLEGVSNVLEGTFGSEADAKGKLTFNYEIAGKQRSRQVDLAAVQGIAFLHTLAANTGSPFCKLIDVNQTALVVQEVSMGPANFAVKTVSGARVDYPHKLVAKLDFTNDKIAFLSELKPAVLIEKSKQGLTHRIKQNKNLDNGVLQIEDQVFTKGLALHAHTELIYTLDGKYSKFEAVLGMDANVQGDGKPKVTIEADGTALLSAIVTRKDKRKELSFPVKGVKQLRIVVSSTGVFDFGEHINLANAKLSK